MDKFNGAICCPYIYINNEDDGSFILFYVWYHGGYAGITVIHRNFSKATLCSFCKITVSHRNSDISTIIPNIGLVDDKQRKRQEI
jgi:hypothetical protein